MLIQLSAKQKEELEQKLDKFGVNFQKGYASALDYKSLHRCLSSFGFNVLNINVGIGTESSPDYRAKKPNYTELGINRVAGPPTDADIQKYAEVTSGGELTKNGFIVQILLFDNDLLTDRFSVGTFNLLKDLYSKYLGRGNDFNHKFDATMNRGRLIDLCIGYDNGTTLHPEIPSATIQKLNPLMSLGDTYTALSGTFALPRLEGDNTIERIQKGLLRDVSIAFWPDFSQCLCSICLKPMSLFFCFTYCEEHGFPGGRTSDGQLVIEITNAAEDAMTFGMVSDGAVKRATMILNPGSNSGITTSIFDPKFVHNGVTITSTRPYTDMFLGGHLSRPTWISKDNTSDPQIIS